MHVLAPSGARVAYRGFGAGQRLLILIHGWMASGRVFDDFVREQPLSEHRLIVVDLVGTGASSRPTTGYSLTRYAADVLAVIEEVTRGQEGLRPVVLGHSMGGQIAQLVAAALSDQLECLVLVNPVPLTGIEVPDEMRGLFRSCAGDVDKLGAIIDMATEELSPAGRERLVAMGAQVEEACIAESFDAWTAGGFEDRLADISAPTLVIATDDAFLPRALLKREVVDRIPNATMRYLAGPGHYPIVERSAETAAIVTAFLAPP